MASNLRQEVIHRASGCCEYCRMPQSGTVLPHELDHIRSRKHHGSTTLENLCLACALCNSAKGPLASGYPPDSDELVRLFNPRIDAWATHFSWRDGLLIGTTAIAHATIEALNINDPARVEHRQLLMEANRFFIDETA